MTSSNNVVRLSMYGPYSDIAPLSSKETLERVEEARKMHIDMMIDDYLPSIVHALVSTGYVVSRDEVVPHMALFIDAFRSMTYKSVGLKHPLQEITDTLYDMSKTEDKKD